MPTQAELCTLCADGAAELLAQLVLRDFEASEYSLQGISELGHIAHGWGSVSAPNVMLLG